MRQRAGARRRRNLSTARRLLPAYANVAELIAKGRARSCVATVLVCADPASQVYAHSKGKLAAELGVANFGHRLSEQASKAKLLALIVKLNADARVERYPGAIAVAQAHLGSARSRSLLPNPPSPSSFRSHFAPSRYLRGVEAGQTFAQRSTPKGYLRIHLITPMRTMDAISVGRDWLWHMV